VSRNVDIRDGSCDNCSVVNRNKVWHDVQSKTTLQTDCDE